MTAKVFQDFVTVGRGDAVVSLFGGDWFMSILEKIHHEVIAYHDKYRNPKLQRPRVSKMYYLDPAQCRSAPAELVWPSTWPQSDSPGVYAFFDHDMTLLYVGKAANLGSRLSAYFRYAEDGTCKVVDDWGKGVPASLVTVAVGEPFEPSSLEEYLIGRLNPPVNKVRTSKPNDQ